MSAPRDVTRWWKKPDQVQGRQGVIVAVRGSDDRITCPKCGLAPVVYNGNYFCDNWAYPDTAAGSCDWALAHPARSERDRAVCLLLGISFDWC
jgi:hypothetical protein